MPAVAGNNLGLNWGWAIGENGWKAGTDNNYKLLELLVQPNVIDKDLTTPPGAPANGDRYLIPPTGATGAWSGHANKLALWDNQISAWLLIAPLEGWRTTVQDEDADYIFNGSTWVYYKSLNTTQPPSAAIGADTRMMISRQATGGGATSIGMQMTFAANGFPGSIGYRNISCAGTFLAPQAVNPTDITYMMYMGVGGYDGTTWVTASKGLAGFKASSTWTNSSHPTDFVVETTATGSTTRAERFRVKNLGQVRFVPLTADPGTVEDGDVWYNSTAGKLRLRAGGVTVDLN